MLGTIIGSVIGGLILGTYWNKKEEKEEKVKADKEAPIKELDERYERKSEDDSDKEEIN